jgi:hypothetical protein
MGNIAICWGMEAVSDCLHPIISNYPIVPLASVPVVRAIGSVITILTTYTLQLVLLRVVQVVWWQHQGTAFPLCVMTVAVTTFPI